MPAPLSKDDTHCGPPAKSPEFDKLVVFSAWLLLASYDEYGDTLEDAAIAAFEKGDSSAGEEVQEPEKLSFLRCWRHLDQLNDKEFQEYLADEILPALRSNCFERSHPLSLVPFALEDKPLALVRREWNRAFELWDDGNLNFADARAEWDVTSGEFSLSQNPVVPPWQFQEFLAEALMPQPGESFLDLSARDGGVASRAAELGVRCFTLYERNLELALLAATRIRLYPACEVSVFHEDPLAAKESEALYDCVVAAPPFGLKVVMPASSSVAVHSPRAELMYLQRAVAALKPGGRAAVLMPNRFLFAAGSDRRVREWLLREHSVEAVVELPGSSIFGAEVKTSVLLIRRQPPRGEVWFISPDQILNAGESPIPGDEAGGIDHEILHTAIAARWNIGKPDELRAEIARLETAAAKAKYEMVEPDGIAWLTQNNRQLLALARYFLDGPKPGVRFPELVPIATLARRNWELLWKDGETESFDAWLKPVAEIAGARIATLGELAEAIFVGIPYTSAKTQVNIGYLVDGKGVGLMRVSDLPKPKSESRVLVNAHKALTGDAITEVAPSQILRDGDLLISRSGTVGKTGFFMNLQHSEQKAVAANGIIVVRIGERMQADFLARLLQSAPYQAALQAATTGSVIRHLRVETIRSLRVPVFPKAEMLRLMEVFRPGVSAETMLAALQSRESYTVALRYLTDRAIVREFASRPPEEPWQETHRVLREVLAELRGAENDAAHGEGDAFLNWTVAFVQVAEDLDEILGFPPGSEQFAALQSWLSRLRTSQFKKAYDEMRRVVDKGDQRDSHSLPQQLLRRCEQLNDRLVALSRSAADALLAQVNLSATIAPPIATIGKLTEVQFSIANCGPLPLRKFEATTTPFGSVTTTPLLPAGGTHVWTLIFTPQVAGRQTVNLVWKAHRLDDQPVSGSIELAVEIRSLRTADLITDLGENPYVYARVLDGEDDRMFYGREKVLDELAATLSRRSATTIKLIEGNRRIGKTSLLRHFVRHRMPEGWLAVFINFQDFEGDSGQQARAGIPTRAIFTGMARELIRAVATAIPGLDIPELGIAPPPTEIAFARYLNRVGTLISADEPFASFRVLIETLRGAVHPRRLLLLLDEFDRVQEGIESGVTSDQVPENIRHLFQTYNDLAGIFTGSRTIRRLRMEYWNVLFGMGEPLKLAGLEEEEARQLIERPVAGRLVFSDEAVRRITMLTARQPLLIQAMCMRIFDLCKAVGERSVGGTLVELVAEEKVADNEHFETLWSHIASNRQRLITFLVDAMESRNENASFDRLLDAGKEAGVPFTQKSLKDALTDLLDLEVLRVTSQPAHARYSIEVPLFARWLRRNKDFAETRAAAEEED